MHHFWTNCWRLLLATGRGWSLLLQLDCGMPARELPFAFFSLYSSVCILQLATPTVRSNNQVEILNLRMPLKNSIEYCGEW